MSSLNDNLTIDEIKYFIIIGKNSSVKLQIIKALSIVKKVRLNLAKSRVFIAFYVILTQVV